jgi:hypothetical protein
VDASAKALSRFEVYNRYRDFRAFHFQQAIAFKNHLADQKGQRSGERLSKATLYATLMQLKRFFQWLALQPGYKSRLQYSDADYFNLSDKGTRIATAQREQKAPTLEQIKHVLRTMPTRTEIERRNRALLAFTVLTGALDCVSHKWPRSAMSMTRVIADQASTALPNALPANGCLPAQAPPARAGAMRRAIERTLIHSAAEVIKFFCRRTDGERCRNRASGRKVGRRHWSSAGHRASANMPGFGARLLRNIHVAIENPQRRAAESRDL